MWSRLFLARVAWLRYILCGIDKLDLLYALKYLHLDHPKLRERMLQEGRLQATLRHPNIVSVHDVLDIDGAPALLMEYISGGSLEELIDYEEI